MLLAVATLVCGLSLAGNGVLFYLLRKSKTRKWDHSAQNLLRDLLNGGSAVIKVTPINRDEIFMRSPRELG